MKKLVKLLSFLLLLGMMAGVTQVSAETEDFIVKVKLNNQLGPYSTYHFMPKGDSVVKENGTALVKGKKYTVQITNQKLTIKEGSTIVAKDLSTVTVEPKIYNKANHLFLYRGDKPDVAHPYMGTIVLRIVETSKIQPVNQLLFEDYLKGVLPGEMSASWGYSNNINSGGMEALKAQAIAARSYVFAKAGGKFTIEIDDTTKFQVFKGFIWDPISPKYLSSYQNTNKAVDETAGQIMTYKKWDGKDGFVTAFFSSSNGGQTELPQQYWSSTLPYVTTSKPDDFDTKDMKWKITWLKQQLNPSLDLSKPSAWWSTEGERGLDAKNMPLANDALAFKKLKERVLTDLQKVDPTIESIKISSIDNIATTDYTNTGKVSEITKNISYYTRHKNGTTLSYDMIPGAQSRTLAGTSRYDTAVDIAREYVGTAKAQTIVLGRGDVPADALAGTVLAHKYNAPIILTRTDTLPASVETFINEKVMAGAKIYLLGGNTAISAELEAKLKSRGFQVVRLSGKDRTGTSIAIAKEVASAGGQALLVTGNDNSSDALSASAYAAVKQIPIIIHRGEKTAAQTKTYLAEAGINKVTLIGGDSVVPEAVKMELQAANYTVERISGVNRVETSVAINQQLPLTGKNIVIGNAYSFIDSLAGSVLAAKTGSPIVLLHPDAEKLSNQFFEELPTKNQAYFLGGSDIVSEQLKSAINVYIESALKKKEMTLTFKGSNKNVYPVTMESYRLMLGAAVLKSVDFNLIEDTDTFVLDGSGFGHGIGMSQYGALRRSQAGHNASQILNFYYDGITIKTRNQIIQ